VQVTEIKPSTAKEKQKKKKEFRTKIPCCVEETLEVAFQFLGDDKGISN
jgi:hypothetical protein